MIFAMLSASHNSYIQRHRPRAGKHAALNGFGEPNRPPRIDYERYEYTRQE